jgi:hypothetical protein
VWRVGGLSHHITAYNIRASDRFPLVWMVLDHTIASHHNRASNRFAIVASHSGVWRVGGTVMCVGDRRIHSGIASRNTTYTTTSERQNGSRSSITPHHSIAHPSIGRIRARVDVLFLIAHSFSFIGWSDPGVSMPQWTHSSTIHGSSSARSKAGQ